MRPHRLRPVFGPENGACFGAAIWCPTPITVNLVIRSQMLRPVRRCSDQCRYSDQCVCGCIPLCVRVWVCVVCVCVGVYVCVCVGVCCACLLMLRSVQMPKSMLISVLRSGHRCSDPCPDALGSVCGCVCFLCVLCVYECAFRALYLPSRPANWTATLGSITGQCV